MPEKLNEAGQIPTGQDDLQEIQVCDILDQLALPPTRQVYHRWGECGVEHPNQIHELDIGSKVVRVLVDDTLELDPAHLTTCVLAAMYHRIQKIRVGYDLPLSKFDIFPVAFRMCV